MARTEGRYRPDPAFLRALSKVVKSLRIKKRQTQEQLAVACNIHWRYLQEIEASENTPDEKLKNPSIGVFLALSEGLGVSATQLMAKILKEEQSGI